MRKTLKFVALAFLAAAALTVMPGQARAVTLPAPTASYDATVTIDSGKNHYVSTVNAAGPLERRSATINGTEETVLVNRATGTITLLMPGLNTALPIDNGGPNEFNITILNKLPVTAEAQEPINGVMTTRYAVNGQTAKGSFTGHVWATPNGILMQVIGDTVHNGKTTPVKAVTSNLQQRPQNPALFTLPVGTKPMAVDILGMLKAAKGTAAAPAP